MLVIEVGISIEVKPEQLQNPEEPIHTTVYSVSPSFTIAGITTSPSTLFPGTLFPGTFFRFPALVLHVFLFSSRTV